MARIRQWPRSPLKSLLVSNTGGSRAAPYWTCGFFLCGGTHPVRIIPGTGNHDPFIFYLRKRPCQAQLSRQGAQPGGLSSASLPSRIDIFSYKPEVSLLLQFLKSWNPWQVSSHSSSGASSSYSSVTLKGEQVKKIRDWPSYHWHGIVTALFLP